MYPAVVHVKSTNIAKNWTLNTSFKPFATYAKYRFNVNWLMVPAVGLSTENLKCKLLDLMMLFSLSKTCYFRIVFKSGNNFLKFDVLLLLLYPHNV